MALHYYFLLIDPVMDSLPRVGFSVYWIGDLLLAFEVLGH